MKIGERAVRHPVTTVLLFVTLAALGFLSSRRVGLEQFPDIGFPTAAIFTVYPGVGPFEVESGVTRPIEEAVSTLSGIEKVSSTSSDGLSRRDRQLRLGHGHGGHGRRYPREDQLHRG